MDIIKQRLLELFKNQSIKLTEVVKNISLSERYFSSKSAMGSDILQNIAKYYPKINMDWVITGRGEMLLKTRLAGLQIEDNNCIKEIQIWKDKYIALMEKHQGLLEQQNILSKRILTKQ